jgi:hypothetical protein
LIYKILEKRDLWHWLLDPRRQFLEICKIVYADQFHQGSTSPSLRRLFPQPLTTPAKNWCRNLLNLGKRRSQFRIALINLKILENKRSVKQGFGYLEAMKFTAKHFYETEKEKLKLKRSKNETLELHLPIHMYFPKGL